MKESIRLIAIIGRLSVAVLGAASIAHAQMPESWSKPQKPFKVYGNTYYVGTQGLGSVLITSQDGHVLIDGALPDSATQIAANIRTLGFRVEDVKVILNSHVHFDHAGGIASLQKLTGAQVAASAIAAKVLMSGKVDSSDPQFGGLPDIPTIATVREIKHGETLKVGSLELTAHFTPGHTPGGTTWSWRSCEQQRCLNVVYVDSLNPISTTGYLYSDPKRNPNGVQQLEGSFKVVEALPCDVLIAPHPDLIDLFGKLAKRDRGEGNAFIDANACRNYAQMARDRLTKRLAEERNR